MAKKEKRFILHSSESTAFAESRILADRKTGVNYFRHSFGGTGG